MLTKISTSVYLDIVREDVELLPAEVQDVLEDACDLTEHTIMVEKWYLNVAEYRAF